MSESFAELGLRAELIEAAHAAGYDRPSALQRAGVPLIRRGSSAVVRAATGAGAMTGVLLAIIDRLAEQPAEDAPGALIITSTEARAGRLAEAAARCGEAVGLRAAALAGGWLPERAALVVGTPAAALRAVQQSALKLDALRTLVVDGAARIAALGGDADLEPLMAIVPREAQRVIVTAELSEGVAHFVEAHARRALNVPARSADEAAAAPAHPDGDVGYIVAGAAARVDALAMLLREHAGRRRAVIVRGRSDHEELTRALPRRGFTTGDDADAVHIEIARFRPDADVVIGFGSPLDTLAFSKIFLSGDAFVVRPAELAHLRGLAAEENLELRPIAAGRAPSDALAAYRALIRRALAEEDVDAQLLVLEPLFDERSPAEIAAALSALLRQRAASAPAASPATAATSSASAAAATPAYVRLFVSVGQRDNVRPADIVGAIAGEANVPGGQVGRIEIRDTFTVVEVPADAAERVIGALNGTTMRGRSVRVDFDRKGGRGEATADRGPGRPRSGGRGGPAGPGGGRGGRAPAQPRR